MRKIEVNKKGFKSLIVSEEGEIYPQKLIPLKTEIDSFKVGDKLSFEPVNIYSKFWTGSEIKPAFHNIVQIESLSPKK